MISPLSERESFLPHSSYLPPAYYQQAIAESGSALSSWAFDSTPEKHAKDVAAFMDCPTDSLPNLINCVKNEKTHEEIVLAHKAYIVSIMLT